MSEKIITIEAPESFDGNGMDFNNLNPMRADMWFLIQARMRIW